MKEALESKLVYKASQLTLLIEPAHQPEVLERDVK